MSSARNSTRVRKWEAVENKTKSNSLKLKI
jgi:hypothetical protein